MLTAQIAAAAGAAVYAFPHLVDIAQQEGLGAALRTTPRIFVRGLRTVSTEFLEGAEYAGCCAIIGGLVGVSILNRPKAPVSLYVEFAFYACKARVVADLAGSAVTFVKNAYNYIARNRGSFDSFATSAVEVSRECGSLVGAIVTSNIIEAVVKWGLG